MFSMQARSKLFGVEAWVTRTSNKDREEDGDKLAYVHYVCGEPQEDCWNE